MSSSSKKSLEKLATLSGLCLTAQETEALYLELEKTLKYTNEILKVCTTVEQKAISKINVFREDKPIAYDSSAILEQAPQRKDDYFVVPKILD